MRHFCTYFDSNYLPRGLALYHSLKRWHETPFTLWVLCFDPLTCEILSKMQLSNVRLMRHTDFEKDDPEILQAKRNRSAVEYYWTCTPSLPLYLLKQHPEIDMITYLDADLLFFSSPQPIYEEFSNHSIMLIEHRYSPAHENLKPVVGIYNVQMMVFRRDANGLEALFWWWKQCIDWCYRKSENGKFGDQLYLNDWPKRFSHTHILQNIGAGVAPWNAARYRLRKVNENLYVEDSPLIFYHYHAFGFLNDWMGVADKWCYQIPKNYFSLLYHPYLSALQESISQIRKIQPDFSRGYESTSLRLLLRWMEQGRLIISIRPETAGRVLRQLSKIQLPRLSGDLKETSGVIKRFFSRRFQKV